MVINISEEPAVFISYPEEGGSRFPPTVNTNSSPCGILTEIQIGGGDGKKSVAVWGRRCWNLPTL